MNSGGADQTAHMRSLISPFAILTQYNCILQKVSVKTEILIESVLFEITKGTFSRYEYRIIAYRLIFPNLNSQKY